MTNICRDNINRIIRKYEKGCKIIGIPLKNLKYIPTDYSSGFSLDYDSYVNR